LREPGRIRFRFSWLILAALVCTPPLSAQFDQAEYEKAARAILCDCGCHPQSVHDCACGRAAEMQREVAALITYGPDGPQGGGQGMTGEEVIAYYVAKHGEKVLLVPKARNFNLVAWLGPLVAFVAAALLMVQLLRRWKRAHAAQPRPAAATLPRADDPYMSRLTRELEKLE